MSTPGENRQACAAALHPDRLDWQSELDRSLADIDTRLKHPRQRAADVGQQPILPQLGETTLTTDLLDEIAWRVAEQLRRTQPVAETAATPAPTRAAAMPAPAPPHEPEPMPPGIAITIRLRKPLFRFRFWRRRRRRESLISFADYRIT